MPALELGDAEVVAYRDPVVLADDNRWVKSIGENRCLPGLDDVLLADIAEFFTVADSPPVD